MLRYSLTTLLLLVLVAALGCAALVYASPLVKQITVTVVVLLLGLAVLVALVGQGRRRAAAVGLAFAGWAYLLLANTGAVKLEQHLLTRDVNRWLYDTLHLQPSTTDVGVVAYQPDGQLLQSGDLDLDGWVNRYMVRDIAAQGNSDAGVFRLHLTDTVRVATFETISHALWALLLGLLGAVTAAVIYGRGRQCSAAEQHE